MVQRECDLPGVECCCRLRDLRYLKSMTISTRNAQRKVKLHVITFFASYCLPVIVPVSIWST